MIDLERGLEELADRLVVPGGEWLADDVVRRIGTPQRQAATRHRAPRFVVAFVAIAMVLIVTVLIVALPGPRRVVARWLGFDSVRIQPGVTVPTTSAALPEPALDLGPEVSIDTAMQRTRLPDPTPTLLGEPLSVHVVQPPLSGQIMLVYAPSALVPRSDVSGVGALVSVMPAHIEAGFFQKTLGDDATVRPVDFGGGRGYWIEGAPHQILFEVGQDQVQDDTLRLATNTLLWERDGHLYRLEADVSLATAVAIAKSVR